MTFSDVQKDLKHEANPAKVALLARFFKTGPGEYGAGDVFLGLTVPQSRILVRKYRELSLPDIQKLLASKYHEARLIALLILVYQFEKGIEKTKQRIYEFYLRQTRFINNWDLVDLSAGKIVGGYLLDKPRTVLYSMAKSKDLWEKRIAIIATSAFINQKQYQDTFKIADMLMGDTHDLIHKAVGWMLREVGKRVSREALIDYLKSRYQKMPRTMLRYAIEHFPQATRKKYLQGLI